MDDGGFVIATDYTKAFALLDQAIEKLEQMKQDPKYRRRSLSIAIHELETGRLWANKSFADYIEAVNEE